MQNNAQKIRERLAGAENILNDYPPGTAVTLPPSEWLKLISITRLLLDVCERQTHPHIEGFCKERARKALEQAAKEVE